MSMNEGVISYVEELYELRSVDAFVTFRIANNTPNNGSFLISRLCERYLFTPPIKVGFSHEV